MKQARTYLNELYEDYINNYLTVAKFAEHNGLHMHEANKLIQLMKITYATKHPDE